MRLENDSTTKIERDIDAALKMLNEVQSPAAMTSRIHRNLATAPTAPQGRPVWSLWISATCTAMAAVLFMVFFQVHSMRRKQTSTVQTARMVAPAALPDVAMPQRRLVSSENFSERKLSAVHVHSISHRKRGEHPPAANLLSYPLTRQEKLLIQFAKTAKPEDLQALNPEYQAKVEAQQEAEFAAYLKAGSSSSYNESTENTQE